MVSRIPTHTNSLKAIITYYSNDNYNLNEQFPGTKRIYVGTKLVNDKISAPLKNANRNLKPGREIKLEPQIRNLRQQAKMLR